MNPSLVALFGSLQGSTFPLTQPELTIGRDTSNWLCISDPLLSRRHCLLKKEGENFSICDLDSLNGIFVNGLPVKTKALQHGDQIEMGDSLFLFLVREDEPSQISSVSHLEDEFLLAKSTTRLKIEDALYLKPEQIEKALPASTQIAHNLNVLLKISASINSIQNPEELMQEILASLFEILPAERGAILMGESCDSYSSIFARDRSLSVLEEIQVSRTVATEVFRDRVAILGNDILQKFRQSESIAESRISSMLCIPLTVFGKVEGILYLDTSNRSVRFDEDQLQLVTAIACLAAIGLKNAYERQSLEEENRRLATDIKLEHSMIGEGNEMQKVYRLISRIAPADTTVLISGESGTGKELAARAIHSNSSRSNGPFVAINCAALPETLLESELFGHEKGAFTGAMAQKKGKLEMANGGTLFLDEVSEIIPALQVKLLRVLQEREFERVGGTNSIKVDIRILSATNRNLLELIQAGTFRQDLYFRLNVVSFEMPPLRERREDIPLLANYFVSKYSKKLPRRVKAISPNARDLLTRFDWPGNVRELENVIERAVVLGSTEMILPEDLPESLHEKQNDDITSSSSRYHETIQNAKRELILKVIEEARGNYIEAAKLLGVHPNYLYRLARNLNIKDKK